MNTSTPCEVCGRSRYELVIQGIRRNPNGQIFRCLECGLVFLNSGARRDEVEGHYRTSYSYEPNYAASPDLWYLTKPSGFLKRRLRLVEPFLSKTTRLLEIGCGAGEFLAAVKPLVAEATGIELNPDQAAAGRQAGLDISSEPIEHLGFLKRFDIICTFQTLEHMLEPRVSLSAIYQALHDEGTLFIEVPNVDDALLAVYGLPEFGPFYYRDTHLYYYSPTTLARLLHGCGFVAQTELVQQYSITNHLHWLHQAGPQGSLLDGMSVTVPRRGTKIPEAVAEELQTFWSQTDDRYRELLVKAGYADTLWCRATKRLSDQGKA